MFSITEITASQNHRIGLGILFRNVLARFYKFFQTFLISPFRSIFNCLIGINHKFSYCVRQPQGKTPETYLGTYQTSMMEPC